jgi:hypothetical protein
MTAGRMAAADATPEDMLPGHLMRLAANGLKTRGFGAHLPAWDEERPMSVERRGGRCDPPVGGFGLCRMGVRPVGQQSGGTGRRDAAEGPIMHGKTGPGRSAASGHARLAASRETPRGATR